MALPKPDIFGAFDEAIRWFRKRVPMTAEEFYALTNQSREKAFTVAGVAQADVIQDVLDSLVKAQEEGLSLKEWKEGITEKLTSAWQGRVSNPAYRLDTIFRTNVQTASSHGRIRQMSHPAVAKLRPYWLYDATRDKRTTDICKKRDKTLLPADDPWWADNIPPMHFGCRSRIRSLRTSQAMRRGGVRRPPADTPAGGEGFGAAPSLDPDKQTSQPAIERDYDPTLDAIRQRTEDAARGRDRQRRAELRRQAATRSERRIEEARSVRDRQLTYLRDHESFRASSIGSIERAYLSRSNDETPTDVAMSLPPIRIDIDDYATGILDGRHRWLAARMYGAERVPAVVRVFGPRGGLLREERIEIDVGSYDTDELRKFADKIYRKDRTSPPKR